MIGDIERELVKAEQALYVMQCEYPKAASRAANARYVYDQTVDLTPRTAAMAA